MYIRSMFNRQVHLISVRKQSVSLMLTRRGWFHLSFIEMIMNWNLSETQSQNSKSDWSIILNWKLQLSQSKFYSLQSNMIRYMVARPIITACTGNTLPAKYILQNNCCLDYGNIISSPGNTSSFQCTEVGKMWLGWMLVDGVRMKRGSLCNQDIMIFLVKI